MRCAGRVVLSLLATAALATPALAQNLPIDLSGRLRIRSETERRPAAGTIEGLSLLQTRIDLSAPVADYATVFVQVQDARTFGEETNTLTDASADRLDFHQAYAELRTDVGEVPVTLRAGRQEILLGSQRLVGPVGWSNTGRSFDAFRLLIQPSEVAWELSGIMATVVEEGTRSSEDPPRVGDHTLFGLALDGPDVRAVVLHDLNAAHRGWVDIDRTTLGAELLHTFEGRLSVGLEGAFQAGSQLPTEGSESTQDVSAWMFGGRLGWMGSAGPIELVQIGADWLSGDEDPDDDEYSAFNTLYATNHKFYGFMDLFLDPARHTGDRGLVDAMATVGVKLREPLLANATVHRFSLASAGDAASDVGWEIDLTAPFQLTGVGTVQAGYSLFVAGDAASLVGLGESGKTRQWGYVQLVVGF